MYTIYTLPQMTERFRTVPGPFGQGQVIENTPLLPGNIVFKPATFDPFSADDAARKMLLANPSGTATMAEILATFPLILDAKYNKLWQAAHAWEQRYISGVGLSILSLGVAQAKPKAQAVAAWSNNLWTNIYYPRKAAISLESEPDCDFSVAGDMPYSVPELSAEVYG